MKIVFYASNKRREIHLAKAFLAGAKAHGFEVERRETHDVPKHTDYQYACMVGVKSKRLWEMMIEKGVTPIMFDKGYNRRRFDNAWQYWRIAVGAHHPSMKALTKTYSLDRFNQLGFRVSDEWRTQGNHILLAGSSAKYHNFYDLPDPTTYARDVVKKLRKYTPREIIYRPKPSWKAAVTVRDTVFSRSSRSIAEDLNNAYCVITHGSNACFDAALMGIPSIILGEGVMKPISSRSIDSVGNLMLKDRAPVFAALAYHQWTLAEMRSGEAFNTIKDWL